MEIVEESEEYLLLDFKENVESKFFSRPNLFFKIINLQEKNPLVQIGNHVFQGKYEPDCMGTHLVFQEVNEQRTPDITSKDSNIHLKYLTETTKQLTLHLLELPEEVLNINQDELVDLEFQDTYEDILRKIENGTLDIKDAIKKPAGNESLNEDSVLKPKQLEVSPGKATESLKKTKRNFYEETNEKCEKQMSNKGKRYNFLKKLVRPEPNLPDYIENFDIMLLNFTNKRHFQILKELCLKTIDYSKVKPFMSEDDNRIDGFVDLEASINDGVIENKIEDNLNASDMEKLISLKNWDNLSARMKLTVLIVYLKDEKHNLQNMDQEMLDSVDCHGLKPKQRYKMLKSLVKDLKYNLFVQTDNDL